MPQYNIQKINPMTCVVNVYLKKNEKTFTIFSMPDAHWDNPKCDRELLTRHLKEAKEKSAVIISGGDFFCLMQGKYDPRRNKSDIRPEHNKANYLDIVIEDAANYLEPYKENIIFGTGNHESAILKSCETNVLERLAGALGNNVVMGYHYWVIFKIYCNNKHYDTLKGYYNHGYGGGGAVTRGQINMSRQMMHIEGADFISNGHIHEKSTTEVMAHYFDSNNMSYKPKARSILLLQSSTYKQEYIDNGFHIEKGRPPKPLGGIFMDVHLRRNSGKNDLEKEVKFRSTQTFDICNK